MKIVKSYFGETIYNYEDENLLAYMGKAKKLVRIITTTENGTIAQYEPVDQPGNRYMPLIENGENVEKFEVIGNQLTLI